MDRSGFENVERIRALLAQPDRAGLDEALAPMHPADIADVLEELGSDERVQILKRLDNERAAEVLTEIDATSGQKLLLLLSDRKVVSLLGEMSSDDAADLMGSMPAENAERVEALLPAEDRDHIQELMEHDEESAGGLMEKEVISVPEDATVDDAIDAVRDRAGEMENIQKIYVVSSTGELRGQISVMDLILHPRSARVGEFMHGNVISIPVGMDQEEVAGVFGKYDEFTLPVVNTDNQLVGRITVDDIIDVIEEEASEDFALIAGTTEHELGEPSVFKVSRTRLPWLITGLVGQLCGALLMSRFEGSLVDLVVLVFFVPLILGTAGSIGIQAAVVVVRELALGQIDPFHLGRRVFKELQVASLNGFVLGTVFFSVVLIWQHNAGLASLLMGALLTVILVASFMGSSIPLVFQRWGIDPAIATGPLISVLNDLVGLSIYLAFATAYLSR